MKPHFSHDDSKENEIKTIETLLTIIERDLFDMGYEIAARQCRMVSIAIIENDICMQRKNTENQKIL